MTRTYTNPHELWDDYRDGDLDADARRAFEQHLAANADLADRFVEETRWLAALKHNAAPLPDADAAFRDAVLHDWLAPQPVGFIRKHRASLAAAASVAIVATLMWVAGRQGPVAGNPADPQRPDRIVKGPAIDDHARDIAVAIDDTPRMSPVSKMVLSVSSTAEAPPRQIRQTFGVARAMLSGDRLLDLLNRSDVELPQIPASPDDPASPRS